MQIPDGEPLVSVVLPTRNRAALLSRAVASVLGQTHRNLELIVINDASTDGTRELLAAIEDPRLRVIHREQNKGAGAARNAGIGIAQGEFVAFQDDDDLWFTQKLEKQVAALRAHPHKAWCIACYIRLDDNAAPDYVGGAWYTRQFDYSLGIGEGGPDWSLIATPAWLLRRDLLSRSGAFDERVRSWDDWELGIRLTDAGGDPVFVDEPLWLQDWRRGSGLIRAERARGNDLRLIMEKHARLWSASRRVRARHWYIVGRIASLYDPAPAGRPELWRSVSLNPLQAKTWAALLFSYLDRDFGMRLTKFVRRLK